MNIQEKYYSSSPYKIVHWDDRKNTGAEGWVVIDKLVNGVAGGGLFMHTDATVGEVTDLAKSMSYKNSLQEPLFGGAKAGIKFDPTHKLAHYVLKRFLLSQKRLLETIWCTGADLNTKNEEIFYITKKYLGLETPFVSLNKMVKKYNNVLPNHEILKESLGIQVERHFTLGDSITGYILAHILKLFCQENNQKTIILQGFGKVGKSFAYYIYNNNIGKIVGIQEKNWALYKKDGININNIIKLEEENRLESVLRKNNGFYSRDNYSTDEEFLIKFLSMTKANIFCPCAKRYTISTKVLNTLVEKTFYSSDSYIISGANNIFLNIEVLKSALEYKIKILPEWVSNSGNALLFLESLKEKEISSDWDKIIYSRILKRVKSFFNEAQRFSLYNKISLYEGCHEYSLQKVKNILP